MSKLSHIQLSEIDEKGKSLEYKSFEALGAEPKELDLKDFHCQLKIHKAGDGYYLNGKINLVREFPCSICGEESEYAQDIKIEEFLRIDPKFDTDTSDIAKSDESKSLVVRSSVWNLKEFIRESVLLEEPIQFYSHVGEKPGHCPQYQKLVDQGILDTDSEDPEKNPFAALKNLRF